jgi:hypothetical protein
MPPATLLLIIQGIEAAIEAAPKVVEVVSKSKDLVTALFTAKLIPKETQDAIHLHIDARAALVAQGITPLHWTVEPDLA